MSDVSPSTGGTSLQRLNRRGATDDWCTPDHIFAALGAFDLDPCVPESGPTPGNTAARHYRPSDDGLSLPWDGMVWLNPPYSAPAAWMKRLAEHGNGIALIFCRTETGWWHEYVWPEARSVMFLRGRLSFLEPTARDRNGHNAPAPSALVAYGGPAARRLKVCGLPGRTVVPMKG